MTFKKTRVKSTSRQLIGTGFVLAVMAFIASTQTSFADQVQITTLDGKVQISGEIVGSLDEHYILNNSAGSFLIDSRLVTCAGLDCPKGSRTALVAEEAPALSIAQTIGHSKATYTYVKAD